MTDSEAALFHAFSHAYNDLGGDPIAFVRWIRRPKTAAFLLDLAQDHMDDVIGRMRARRAAQERGWAKPRRNRRG